jgi:hypothetical protein
MFALRWWVICQSREGPLTYQYRIVWEKWTRLAE